MQITVRTARSRQRSCPDPPTSSGPIYAETCSVAREVSGTPAEPKWTVHGLEVFVLTTSQVASVSIAGGVRVPTVAGTTLPDRLRAAALWRPGEEFVPGFDKHCPAVAAFDISGATIPSQDGAEVPLRDSPLPTTTWERPGRPPRGPCEMQASRLPPNTTARGGMVVRKIVPVRKVLARGFLSCDSTSYVRPEGGFITAAILLDAAKPGAAPPPLPGMHAFAKHPGIFLAPSSERTILARRIAHAWLVVSEETPEGLAAPLALLEHLRAHIEI